MRCAQERARFEAEALREEARHCPEHVPELYHFDASLCLLVMQYLPPPHLVLRPALTAGHSYPRLARHIAHFMAATLFRTSLFALDSKAWRCVCAPLQGPFSTMPFPLWILRVLHKTTDDRLKTVSEKS